LNPDLVAHHFSWRVVALFIVAPENFCNSRAFGGAVAISSHRSQKILRALDSLIGIDRSTLHARGLPLNFEHGFFRHKNDLRGKPRRGPENPYKMGSSVTRR
jgi:hypothetical protein